MTGLNLRVRPRFFAAPGALSAVFCHGAKPFKCGLSGRLLPLCGTANVPPTLGLRVVQGRRWKFYSGSLLW